jgi:hypothetical protein
LFILIYLNVSHQVPLHDIELRHQQTGHQTILIISIYLFVLNNFDGASSAALQQGVAAPDRAPNYVLFHFNLFSLIHSNCALEEDDPRVGGQWRKTPR